MNQVSISGIDGSGKSVQTELMTVGTSMVNAGTIGNYTDKIPMHLSGPEYFKWWFEEVSPFELASALTDGFINRKKAHETEEAVVFDRGLGMVQAVIMANFMTRSGCDVETGFDLSDDLLLSQGITRGAQPQEIFLKRDQRYSARRKANILRKSPFSQEQNELYTEYQSNLKQCIDYVIDQDSINVLAAEGSAIELQNDLRKALNDTFTLPLPELVAELRHLVGFTGMSESGKSAVASEVSSLPGTMRLKLKYFDDIVRNVANKNELNIDMQVCVEIIRFLQAHYYVHTATIESHHSSGIVEGLDALLGERFDLIFMDAPDGIRRSRADGSVESQVIKDEMKEKSGVRELRAMASLVLSSSIMSAAENATILNNYLRQKEVAMEKPSKSVAINLVSSFDALDKSGDEAHPSRARAIIFDQDETSILIIRRVKNGRKYATLPGGGIEDSDESSIAAVKRELDEELNLSSGYSIYDGSGIIGNELFVIAKIHDPNFQAILGGPEKNRQNSDNQYFVEWCRLDDLSQINLMPPEAATMIEEEYERAR